MSIPLQIWVGNVNYYASEEHLIKLIKDLTGVEPLSCAFHKTQNGNYGFLSVRTEEEANNILKLNKNPIPPDNQHSFDFNMSRFQQTNQTSEMANGFQVYINPLQQDTTDVQLFQFLQRICPKIRGVKCIRDNSGLCKGFGFAIFNSYADMIDCIKKVTNVVFQEKPLKAREGTNNYKFDKTADLSQSRTLFIQNLDPTQITKDFLRYQFSIYGTVKKVSIHPNHRDWAFVTMETHDEAEHAKNELQNKSFGGSSNILIQFGVDNTEEEAGNNKVTVPQLKNPTINRKKYVEIFNEEGVDKIMKTIQQFAAMQRPKVIPMAIPTHNNKIYEKETLQETKIFDWGSIEAFPSSMVFWYYP